MGHVWIFQPDNNPNTDLKNKTKMGHWAQNQASATAIAVLWPEPCRTLLFWQMEVSKSILEKGAVNCVQCVSEKNIYFVMIFIMTPHPILNSYSPMNG